jgi:hypothetical protein
MNSSAVTSLADFFSRAALFIETMPSGAAIAQASTAELFARVREGEALRREARYIEAALALELVLRRHRPTPMQAGSCLLIVRPE